MKKVTNLILMSITAFAMVSGFSASATNGDISILVADQDGTLNFSVDYAANAFLLVGFETSPIILDVSNEEAPVFLSGLEIETASDIGCYLSLDQDADIFATSEIIEVAEIDLY